MGRRPRQLLLVAAGEDVALPPEVQAGVAKGMGTLILRVLRIESAREPGAGVQRMGGSDDPRL